MTVPASPPTFLFTDIEGSTKLWEQRPEAMRLALARHDALMHAEIAGRQGRVFKTIGDAFCAVFGSAPDALEAALAIQAALFSWNSAEAEMPPLRVRMALHAGHAEERDGDYFGPALNRTARLLAIGHGGQTLLSAAARDAACGGTPPEVRLLDLKSHRLKDLSQPEHVWQASWMGLPQEFPPLRSLGANNLPVQLTSFVGREAALAEVKILMDRQRLLTLVGPGGAGKTRLALQAAAESVPDDGVWMVDLAPLTDPTLVTQAVASVLNVGEEPERPLLRTLADSLRSKQMLLILDNCEHLLDAAAALVQSLLQSCPGVRLLATSRERLGLTGEQAYPVPSLALPSFDLPQTALSVGSSEAGRLFLDRAALFPGFAVTDSDAPALARLCRRLDGIPLALELAAARTRSLTVEQIDARLDQRFRLLTGGSRTALPRHQTLQGLMDWSYELLLPRERHLLAALSVFSGGWTLAAAEAVCTDEETEDWEVLDLVTSLVDKSLVVFDSQRYRLLETVRLYARSRLDESPDAGAARTRHARYFLALGQEMEPQFYDPDAAAAFNQVETEHDNFRAALAWFQTKGDAAEALHLATSLLRFWQVRGYLSEGRGILEAAVSLNSRGEANRNQAAALSSAGILAYLQGDLPGAAALMQRSADAYRQLGDSKRLNAIRSNMGGLLTEMGDYAQGRVVLEEVLAYQQQHSDLESVAATWGQLGDLARQEGNYAAAEPLLTQSLAVFRTTGNDHAVAVQLNNLARVAARLGNPAAGGYVREALVLRRKLGDVKGILWSLDAAAGLAAAEGRLGEAARLYGAGAALEQTQGMTASHAELAGRAYFLVLIRAGLTASDFAAAWAEGQALTLDQAVDAVLNNAD